MVFYFNIVATKVTLFFLWVIKKHKSAMLHVLKYCHYPYTVRPCVTITWHWENPDSMANGSWWIKTFVAV